MMILRLQFILIALGVSVITSAQQILDSIPFKYEKGSILVDAKINGKDCKLIFDTGSPHTDFTGAFAKELGWSYPKEKERPGKVQIGTYTTEVNLRAWEKAPFDCPSFTVGRIGYSIMKGKIWMIDYRKEKIYILAEPPVISGLIEIIPFRIRGDQMCANVSINKSEKEDLKIDTGFSSIGKRPFMLGERFLNADSNGLDTVCYEGTCGKMVCRKTATVHVAFSDKHEIYLDALVTKSPIVPVLGNAFFDRYKPVFDLKNNQLLLVAISPEDK
jgi:hypothetical protein